MKLLAVGSEIFPLVKTGGLADVLGALPRAVAQEGVSTVTLIPGYPSVMAESGAGEILLRYPELQGAAAQIIGTRVAGLDLLVLDAPHLYTRPGGPYLDPRGFDWADNAQRFGALARVGADLASGAIPALGFDVVQAHDWQAGLLPAYLRYGGRRGPPSIMTVHNLAYQGQFPADLLGTLGLPPESFTIDGVEYFGSIGFLKAGLRCANAITTVSPSYATEILSPEMGMGLHGLFRERSGALVGILNGLDTKIWDPATDGHLAARFDAHTLIKREMNRMAAQRAAGLLEVDGRMLIGLVSRLTWQKGVDLVLECLDTVRAIGAQFIALGSGDAELQNQLERAASANPGMIGFLKGFDETMAHRIQGGADAILLPSRFEPCGLTQLAAQHYGAVPIVSKVGGLIDTVIDANEAALSVGVATGIQFAPTTADGLRTALRRAANIYADQNVWRKLQINGMQLDVSWSVPARHYANLYRHLANQSH